MTQKTKDADINPCTEVGGQQERARTNSEYWFLKALNT